MQYWPLNNEENLVVPTATFTVGAAIERLRPGRVVGDYSMRFNRSNPSNSFIQSIPTPYTGAHSIEILLKIGTIPAGQSPHICLSINGEATAWYMSTTDPANPTMSFQLGGPGGNYFSPTGLGAGALVPGTWHHCVLAVGADGSWELFIDAVSMGTGIWARTGSPTFFKGPFTPVFIVGYNGLSAFAFEGFMQHFAVYNTKLNSTTVAAHVAALGPEPTFTYRPATSFAAPLYTRVYNFRVATVTKSIPRALAIASVGGTSRASRFGPPGGFMLPLGTTINAPSVVGGVSRPGRMAGVPPSGFTLPVPIAGKLVAFGAGGGGRPLAGQVWPPPR